VTIGTRTLSSNELDHELLWGWVGLTGLGVATVIAARFGVLPLVCPFRALTGLPCLTCGASRAFVALVSGDLAASLRLHPLVAPAVAAAAGYVPYALAAAHLGTPRLRVLTSEKERRWMRTGVVALALAVWAYLIAAGR
jgi:hypothetical protein